jgi:aryl-alcohol dehydrogenase-like predicted oxidoreductase
MSFGSPKVLPWVLNQEKSTEIIKEAYERGINYFDAADLYVNGESERVVGNALREIGAVRERIVIATKLFMPVYDGLTKPPGNMYKDSQMVNRWGLSRKHIFDAIDASLERLGVDYIDLYQIHRFDPVSGIHTSH